MQSKLLVLLISKTELVEWKEFCYISVLVKQARVSFLNFFMLYNEIFALSFFTLH